MNLERVIFSNLLNNETYARKTIPFLSSQYFHNLSDRVVFELIDRYVAKYNAFPTKEALLIDLSAKDSISEDQFKECKTIIEEIPDHPDHISNIDWLVDQTERFCQDKAIYNAIMQSIKILDDKTGKFTKGAIPQLLSDALAVSFDMSIGHDFMDDADARFEFYHRKEKRLPFDIDFLNRITKGGLPRKTLNILLAGCVHPDTKVRIRLNNTVEKEISIGEIKNLLDENKVEIYSPDGFVSVNHFIDKGIWPEYILRLDSGVEVSCNENHLFETTSGWKFAKDLLNSGEDVFLTAYGYDRGIVVKTGRDIPIVDINVDHENHRYYTNGVSSHNTGVGKTLAMCHFAASYLASGKNVLYVTLEMSEERIAERIDANLLNVPLNELSELPRESYNKKIQRLKEKTVGKLIIKEYPTSTAGAANFRHLLNELKIKRNFIPDVIFVDYLNICSSSRLKQGANVNSYTYIKAIAEELRGLAVEFNVPLISATQTTRGGYDSSDVGLTDTSECIYINETVTLIDGTKKHIGDVKIGDQIISNDGFKTTMVVHHKKVRPCVQIITASGKSIIVSKDHVFPVKDISGNISRKSVNTGLTVKDIVATTK